MTGADPPGDGRAGRVLAGAYAVFALAFAAAVALLALREHQTLPNFDDWRAIAGLDRLSFGQWLFSSQNGHLMPATLLLFHVDYVHLSGHAHLLVVSSLLCTGLAAGALIAVFRAGAEPNPPFATITLVFALFVLFWAGSLQSFYWGRALHNPMTIAWLLVAVACLVRHATGSRGLAWLILGVVAALLATFSFGTGFATWAALLAVALAARLPLRTFALVAAGAGLSLLAYGAALAGDATRSLTFARRVGERPLDAAGFVASFLGSAVGRAFDAFGGGAESASAVAGAVALLFFGVYALWLGRRTRREPARPRALLALALMSFALASAVMASLARAGFESAEAVKVRFVPWSALFWMGAACGLAAVAAETGSRRLALGVALALPLASLALLPASFAARRANEARRSTLEEGSLALLAGLRNDTLAHRLVGGRPEHVYDALPRLERDGRGPYADPRAGLPGRRLQELRPPAAEGRCRGAIEELRGLPGDGAIGARLAGWAWDLGRDEAPDFVLIADAAGRVRGLGNIAPATAARGARWYAFMGRVDRGARYLAYAALADGIACRFGAPIRVSRETFAGVSADAAPGAGRAAPPGTAPADPSAPPSPR